MQSKFLDRLQQNLAQVDYRAALAACEVTYPSARLGAVLVLFYPRDGQPTLVLTRRTADLRLHSGQISFPGGRIDPEDESAASAARRETLEELGVRTEDLPLLGPLEPVYTIASNFILLPFVAFAPARPTFIPNPFEVAEVIELPLRHLLEPATVENEIWEIRGERRLIAFYRFGEHKIWGATARVLRQILDLAGGPQPPTHLVGPGDVMPDVRMAERER
jgi:8-oxo-dGTP pyrophosphatase MutT (NUDIX family)